MKKQHTVMIVLLSLIVIAVPVFAQGQGKSVGAGKAPMGPNTHVKTDDKSTASAEAKESKEQKGSADAKASAKTHEQTTIASRIESNDKLASRVKLLLPAGMSLADASSGFKNQGQFIAALHVSQNLNIPFDQLKAKMTGTDHMSLGAAVHSLRPDLPADETGKEVKKAEAQTKTTEATGTNPKAARR